MNLLVEFSIELVATYPTVIVADDMIKSRITKIVIATTNEVLS